MADDDVVAAGDRGPGSLDAALARARAGDESGFRELWVELQPRLLRYLQVRSPGSAEDVAAETWLNVVRDLSSFIGDAEGFRGWLFTVARHRAIDAARAGAARPVTYVADVSDTVGSAEAAAPSAESQAIERVSTRSAIRMVAALPPEQAEMVMLRVVAGLDVALVARIVGKSPGAVRVSVHRGLRALSTAPGFQEHGGARQQGGVRPTTATAPQVVTSPAGGRSDATT